MNIATNRYNAINGKKWQVVAGSIKRENLGKVQTYKEELLFRCIPGYSKWILNA